MGIHDRTYYRDSEQNFSWGVGPKWSGVNIIIAACVAVYLADIVSMGLVAADKRQTFGLMNWLAARTSDLSIYTPWLWLRMFTSGFAHSPIDQSPGIWHLGMNLFMLWMLGRSVEQEIGRPRFLTLYLLSITLCSLLTIVFYKLMGQPYSLIGASGGVTTVIIYFVFQAPHARILLFGAIPMPVWLLGLGLVLNDFFGALMRTVGVGESSTSFACHLIGAALGAIFFKVGIPGGTWAIDLKNWYRRRKFKLVRYEEEKKEQVASDADRILEKVHVEGYENLSDREKKLLEKYSRQMKQKSKP